MASPALSQASTAFESDAPQLQDPPKPEGRAALQRAKEAATSQDILLFLIAFRILNALSIRTFFQPDEYFQSLEPAWQIAFGADSGAWITWVRAAIPRNLQIMLMIHLGMEEPITIRYPSGFVCWCLQVVCGNLQAVSIEPNGPG